MFRPVGDGHFRFVLAGVEIAGGDDTENWKEDGQQAKTQALLVHAGTLKIGNEAPIIGAVGAAGRSGMTLSPAGKGYST